MTKKFNIWFVLSFTISLFVCIPIITVFSSFFQNTSNYYEVLKDTFLIEYILNSLTLLILVLIFTFILGTGTGGTLMGLQKGIEEEKMNTKIVSVCGHSLGGAMAHLFALYISDVLSNTVKLYTYGSPRVGGWSFNKVWNDNKIEAYRFRNNNDVVPGVPFAIMGYKHVGELCYINHYGNIRKMTYWQRLKDKLRGRWRALQKGQPFDGVFDHSITLYSKKIEKQFG